MSFLFNVLMFVLVMGIIVLIHELGHLLAAKKFGVYCKEFAIGMGPTLWKVKKPHWETTYSIRALPLGGFVSMAGEPGEEDMNVPLERTMKGIKNWQKLIVILAGVTMNFILAFLIFWGLFSYHGTVDSPKPVIASVQEGYPAETAGLLPGDHIIELKFSDGTVVKPKTFQDILVGVTTYEGREMTVTVDREGTIESVQLSPQKIVENDQVRYVIGIVAEPGEYRSLSILEAIPVAWSQMMFLIQQLVFLLARLVKGIGLSSVGGPISIFKVTSEIRNSGFTFFLNLVAALSLNLAVINLVPIPIMDGGRAVLIIIESIIRRPIPEKLENVIMFIGLAIMVLLFVFIMINDLT
ncbi:MAG: M50 family metallopeptidase [Erysipelothrix sp.]